MLGQCWAHVGSFGGLCGASRRFLEGRITAAKKFFVHVLLGGFLDYLGPMLGKLGSKFVSSEILVRGAFPLWYFSGPCWVLWWANGVPLKFLGWKK